MRIPFATSLFTAAMVACLGCGGTTVAPPGGDGGPEGGSPEAGSPKGCAAFQPAPLFCDDFDEGTTLSKWTSSNAMSGTIAVQEGDSVSAPNAMKSTIQPGTASAYATIQVQQQGLKHASLSFSIRLDPACFTGTDTNNGLVGVGTVVFGVGPISYALALFASGDTSLVFESGGASGADGGAGGYLPAAKIPNGKWARVAMDVDVTKKTVTTSIDGATPTVSMLAAAPDALNGSLVSVGLDGAVSHPTGCSALYDDVSFDGGS
jgi:hypothetical protein